MRQYALFISFFFVSNVAYAQVTTIKSGMWSDPEIWSNFSSPIDTSSVVLKHNVIVDINSACKSLNLSGYTMTLSPGVNINIGFEDGILKDIDSNIYTSARLAGHVWMQQNLNTSHYRNGDTIPEVQESSRWDTLTSGAWCYYQNSLQNGNQYGKLYNWYAVNDPRGLSPEGWHIPSIAEWTQLADNFGGQATAGGALKEPGTLRWRAPNTGATNRSGLTCLPGGVRFIVSPDSFAYSTEYGSWWSSTEYDSLNSWSVYLYHGSNVMFTDNGVGSDSLKKDGFSVRCVKD